MSSKQLCFEGEMRKWQLFVTVGTWHSRACFKAWGIWVHCLLCHSAANEAGNSVFWPVGCTMLFPWGRTKKPHSFGFVFASKPQSTSRSHIFPSCLNSLTMSRHFLIVVPFLNTQKSRYLSGQRYVQYHCLCHLFESVFVINVQMPWELIRSKRNNSREV